MRPRAQFYDKRNIAAPFVRVRFFWFTGLPWNVIVSSLRHPGCGSEFHHRTSAVQHVALPQRGWLPSRLDKIFTGVKRCILLIQCEILLLSALFPISLFTMGWERGRAREKERKREREGGRENPRSDLSCFLALYFKRSWGVAERKS